jgi:hypothetical protein
VTSIHYSKGKITYSTFDASASDVLRVDFVPEVITAQGKPLARRKDLDQAGYTFDDATHVLRIRHDEARDIDIEGKDNKETPLYITFDDPHMAAGTVLQSQYPAGVIDWGAGDWMIHVPGGAFGTFNLSLVDAKSSSAKFNFYWPRVFVGVDAYNGGTSDAVITVHSPETSAVSFTIKPGQVQRLRTDWRNRSSIVMFDFKNGEGLTFDNLAYAAE